MGENEKRFTGMGEIYAKFRPTYPQELFDYLYSDVGFTDKSVIADIGAGTGIFSRLLLERGSKVYAVEPNDDMRNIAEKDLAEYKNFISVNSSAENITLPDSSIDFITVAQAFHWFDRDLFKKECVRILKPGGKVALVWNIRDYKNGIIKKDYVIREKYCIDRKGLGVNGGPPEDCADFFANKICDCRTFQNDLIFDCENYIGRNLSASYAPKEETDPKKYHGLVRELGELFDEYSINGILNFPHFTLSHVGTV